MWAKFEKPCTIWKVVLLSSPVLISSAKMTLLGLRGHTGGFAQHNKPYSSVIVHYRTRVLKLKPVAC